VTEHLFRDALAARLASASARISLTDGQTALLEGYWRLLERWNSRINLTSLPLEHYAAPTIDRLIVEPLMAGPLMPPEPFDWYDLGSGGGSPALPLKVLNPAARLTMVESRARKAAFLREVVRNMGFAATATVATARLENVAGERPGVADCITVRAVRADEALIDATLRLVRPGGRLVLFESGAGDRQLPRYDLVNKVEVAGTAAVIRAFVPRGTKS
jgi:16S rRNA (guanine527-N7)-methyltransferase